MGFNETQGTVPDTAAGDASPAPIDSQSLITSIEPATGQPIWSGPRGNVAELVANARQHWPAWAVNPVSYRVEALRRFANIVRAKQDQLADLIARETGLPLWLARGDVETIPTMVESAVAGFTDRASQRRSEGAMGARTAVRHKPLGVVGVIGPSSSPVLQPLAHSLPALLAGNAVIYKPSRHVPACGFLLAQCLHEAGINPNLFQILIGDAREGQTLALNQGVDGLFFSGKSKTGALLHRAFSETPNRLLSLNLSGNNPIVVWETSDIASAAALVVQSAFFNCGQSNTSARRLIVQEGQHEALLHEVQKLTKKLIVGAPLDTPPPFMGPLMDMAAQDDVLEYFLDLMMKGGMPLHPMRKLSETLPFLSPTLIDVTKIVSRKDSDIAGPILQIIRVPDFESAIAEANATRYGLCASIITQHPKLYEQFWANMRCGLIHWNRATNAPLTSGPQGGTGMSGNFRPGGSYAADSCAYPVISSETEQLRALLGVGISHS